MMAGIVGHQDTVSQESGQLTQAEIDEFTEMFELFDSDGSGLMAADDLGMALRALGHVLTEAEVLKLRQDIDINGTNTIEISEFLKLLTERPVRENDSEVELQRAFATFDKDGSGLVSVPELRYAMTCLGETLTGEQLDEMLRELAPDGDGRVRYDEFVQMMK